MKTYYFLKTVMPFIFLPVAPGVLQVELVRQGLLGSNVGLTYAVVMQVLFTFGIVAWLFRIVRRRGEKSFLRMSCVSKKVFHDGKWVSVERYLSEKHNVIVSHGMTPEESSEWSQQAEAYLRQVDVRMQCEKAIAA
jgi:hypothetical protein